MTTLSATQKLPVTSLQALVTQRDAVGPDWLAPRRDAAAAAFLRMGLPTTRHEDWRFTNLDSIRKTSFTLDSEVGMPDAADVAGHDIPGIEPAARVVFVNGRHAPQFSSVDALPQGVIVTSLAEALTQHRALVEPHLDQHTDVEGEAFTALNSALWADGLFVHIPDDARIERPIVALFITVTGESAVLTSPRNLIIAGKRAQGAVIEQFVAAREDSVYLTNAVTEFIGDEGAAVEHYRLETESLAGFNVSTLHMHQGRNGHLLSHAVLLGGRLVCNNVRPVLAGEGGNCVINGLYVPHQNQHIDNHMLVRHAAPHNDSRQFYRGVLCDKSRAVFSGRIIVDKIAQKTDAKQSNANMLLSDDAQVNTQPQLEIYADDVKCTHGATIGSIDPDAVFYLESRGISREAARALLVYSFVAESLELMKLQAFRDHVEQLLLERLPHGDLVNEVL